jgi:hypothetical protein
MTTVIDTINEQYSNIIKNMKIFKSIPGYDISKYKILGKFGDKWWNSVQIPFKFHTESRDIITECSARELKGEVNACEHSVREYYNKSNVYNSKINSWDITTIEFAKNQLLN